MIPSKKTHIGSRIRSFGFAMRGIAVTFKGQVNFRIHIFIAICVITTGFILNINAMEWVVILLTIAMVLSLEAMNTAIEHLVDLVSPTHHEMAGKVKDIAAGAVLIGAIAAAAIGIIIFGQKLFT